jgi:hypothetical protein
MSGNANFTINGNATPPELAVAASSLVTLALTSTSGVRTIAWSIVGNSSDLLVNPTITPAGSPLGATATFTMPSGTGQAYLVQCLVNNGRDDEGVEDGALKKRAIIGVVNGAGFVPFAFGEELERGDYGYLEALNALGDLGGTPAIGDNSVTFAKMQDIGVGLIGNDTGTADPKLITLGSSLAFSAGALTVATGGVALAMLANIATATFIGRTTAGTGVPEALTATQATALLNVFSSSLKGLVPASGGGTTNFLRADGTFAPPTATATPVGSDTQLQYNNAGATGGTGGVTFPGANRLAFAAETTNSNLQFEHNTVIAKVRNQANSAYVPALTWGAANDELVIGDGTGTASVATIRSRVELAGSHIWEVVTGTAIAALTSAGLALTPAAGTGTVVPSLKVTGAAHTALTASTERHAVQFDLSSTKQFATGAITTQREFRIQAPTYGFVGASVITTAATVAISAAPIAGTNATITNGYALLIEGGSIGFGSTTTSRGLINVGVGGFGANGGLIVGGRTANGATEVDVLRVDSTNKIFIGGTSGIENVVLAVASTFGGEFRVNNTAEYSWNATEFDFKSNNIVNVLALNGVRVAVGVLGTALPDADTTISVSGGGIYELAALTSAHSVGVAVTGSPVNKQTISIRKFATGFTYSVNDEASLLLFQFPAGKGIADFQFNSATNKFVFVGYMPLA